ncbi:MAG: M56 family metallopeptidase [Bacteroidia bacterium]|nr:MAG: M56 family metallopeptidase [Bacteroidia bacterium]
MVRFIIYLLETGICLSLLYLAWWLFLRKETYFNFNRIFLVGSIALALLVPVLHLSLSIPPGSTLENPARRVVRFRSSYEVLIGILDADFGAEPRSVHSVSGEGQAGEVFGEGGTIPAEQNHGATLNKDTDPSRSGSRLSGINNGLSNILLIIYIGGVAYFFARFVYLAVRLYLLAKRNRVSRQGGFRMVEIEEDISPFSFFRFLFINHRSFNESELPQVLEHEKAHIRQKHSMDHLFAHGLAVFQWFNPFAWQMRKALKTTHEYIADQQVIDRGIERLDYQALLLKQVIGYHSVELVNNFNLKPIKQRIAMMNKNRSGMPAKLKATLVAPFAILVFFLFADFTLKGSDSELPDPLNELSGLWIKQTVDDFSHTLYIKDDKLSFPEGIEIREFYLKAEGGSLILSGREGAAGTKIRYELKGTELNLWWNDSQLSRYNKSSSKNTLDQILTEQKLQIELPYISQYRLMENEDLLYRICMGKKEDGTTAFTFNGSPFKLKELTGRVEKEQGKLSKLDQSSINALFLVDRGVPMEQMDQVRQVLRKMGALHFAEGGYPHGDIELSPLLYHAVALPRLLPPLNAKILDKKEMEKAGGKVITIDLAARNTTPRDVDQNLQQFIRENQGKYVISLEYDGAVPYGQYVESVDMVTMVVYRFRKEQALEKYSAPYDKLGDDLQREIRKIYPMALSETMKD